MGFPKTLIDAARAPNNTINDKGTRSSEKREDDPEDIKVIHFGIV